MKKNKNRVILVILFIIIFIIYIIVNIRGEYLKILEIGQEYISVFYQNMKYKLSILAINFIVLYIATYITTRFIKRGLKKFFDNDKKEMPKFPNKSICLIFSTIISVIASNIIREKTLVAINSAWFGINDPIFNLDIGYYLFQKPFIKMMIIYFIILVAIYLIYIVAYYIIIFNMYFTKGIDPAILKKNTFIKQIITSIILIVIGLSTYTVISVHDVVCNKFLNLSNNTSLYGAGLIDVTVKVWGYRLLSVIMLICTILSIKYFKKGSFKKLMIALCCIPIYLTILFIVIIGFDLFYVKSNELDKEKNYISYNIDFTKRAYNVNVDEIEVPNGGTITSENIVNNQEVIDNINLLNKNIISDTLNQYQTNAGYYSYSTTKPGIYNIEGKNQLVYISPREIIANDTRTYNNKTYEYTHGYGIIVTSANSVDEKGNIEYIQSEFSSNDKIKINEPRIYFGLETNEPIIINAKNKQEYDYTVNNAITNTNSYDGKAGLTLRFLDRFILGIKEKKLALAFSKNITQDSKIITTRNIIDRAKTVMPYLKYDEKPYMIVTNDGNLVWVLDAYTTSNNYPYSQETIIEYRELKEKINYIRNSVKVLIDPYNGDIKFYITDETDPVVSVYKKLYPRLFQEESLPEEVAEKVVYSEYLFNIQAQILKNYHNMQEEVLYRQDDVWTISKENTTRNTKTTSSKDIKPYYTQIKTIDDDSSCLGLIIPYTIENKQNIISYLVGTYDKHNKQKLRIYKFKTENAILGTMQLDMLVEQDEKILKELNSLNIMGTRIEKNIIVVPINDILLYVEPIYQVMLNDKSKVPLLKKVVIASGNKVAIGNNIRVALTNLLSQEAIDIEIIGENKDELIRQIINANKNLEQSNDSNNWEMIGKDITKLQKLIVELEKIVQKEMETSNKLIENNVE